MQTLRNGSRGKDVEKWQNFLRGINLYKNVVDGKFGPATEEATKQFQRKHVVSVTGSKRDVDGVVGNTTYSIAASKFGFELVKSDTDGKHGPNWPPAPDFKSLSRSQKEKLFGRIEYVPAPTKNNPEGIKITNNWQKENLTRVVIPQLKGVKGAPKSGSIFWHKKGVDQIVGLFEAWEAAGLIDRVLTWGGSWVPRFIRGSRTTLSNHCIATAFDINVAWNGLGRQPALVGRKGSVRELVEIANKKYFYWGGHWKNRPDGMHFELGK